MRVAVNAHLLPRGATYRSAGVATYTRELTARLPRVAPQNEYVFYAPPGTSGPGMTPSRLPTWNPNLRILWEQSILPLALVRDKIDLLHAPVNVTPMVRLRPAVVTIHDLAFLHFPELFTSSRARYLKAMVGRSASHARIVITPSHSTAADVLEHFNVDPARIRVIPLGVHERFVPADSHPSPRLAPYILYVGTLEPRKGVTTLIRAFDRLRAAAADHRLVLIGAPGWKYDEIFAEISQRSLADVVDVKGFVDDLLPWYQDADMFVYPSKYEGFGLPPLEAMAAGVPVITTNGGSLAELVAGAALTVPFGDVEALSDAMQLLIDDNKKASALRTAGLARAGVFSWDTTVHETALVYESALKDS